MNENPFHRARNRSAMMRGVIGCLLYFFVHVSHSLAATYYAGPASSSIHWNQTTQWWNSSTYTGSQPTAITSADSWVLTTGGTLRCVAGTFAGGTLQMNGGTLMLKGGSTTILPSLIASGGVIVDDSSARGITITNFNVAAGTTTLRATVAGNQRTITTLAGSGNLFLEAAGSTSSVLGLTINSALNYTGTMTIINSPGRVDFNNAVTSGGSLNIDIGGRLILDQNLTFNNVAIAGVPLEVGTHSVSTLAAAYPGVFSGTGGSITVANMAMGEEYFHEGFELPANSLSTAWTWSQTGGTGGVTYATTDVHGGARAAQITRSGTGTFALRHKLPLSVPQYENFYDCIPAMPGQTFHLSWWAKSSNSAAAEFQVVAMNNNTVFNVNILPAPAKTISGTQPWTEFTTLFTIPVGANAFFFRVIGSGTTNVTIDDISLLRLDRPKVTGWATQRVKESLGRSVAAYRNGNQVYIGWRFLSSDSPNVGFNVFRTAPGGSAVQLNSSLITGSTNFMDPSPPAVPAFTPSAPPAGAYYIEAENYTSLDGHMSVIQNPDASGGAYLEVDAPGGSTETAPTTGIAVYQLNNLTAGTYKIWGRVSTHTNQNNLWVKMNSDGFRRWINIPVNAGWIWDDVHHVQSTTPYIVTLAAGNHTLYVGRGRAGVMLDKIYVTRLEDTPVDPVPPPYHVTYRVDTVLNGSVVNQSQTSVNLRGESKNYVSVPVPANVGKVGIGDLDGDGVYDYVVQTPNSSIDPEESLWDPSPTTYKLHGIKSDGTVLWTFDRGWSIELGVWYSPFVVFDFNGDGKAEVALKSGEGDPRVNGRVRTGPEYVSILDGLTGKIVSSLPWPDRTDINKDNDLNTYNHQSRNQIGVAYLDGNTPCIMAARGTYDDMKLHAFQYKGEVLMPLWQWCSRAEGNFFSRYHYQGAHSMHAADVDDDGRDEVVLGSCVIDDNGQGLWSTALKHCDHAYVGELDPLEPGMEIYYGYETGRAINGISMWGAKEGNLLWGLQQATTHIHREGMAADINPLTIGVETWSGEDKPTSTGLLLRYYHSAQGEDVDGHNGMFTNNAIRYGTVYWGNTPYRHVVVDDVIAGYAPAPVSVIRKYPFDATTLASDWQWNTTLNSATYLSEGYVRISTLGQGDSYFEHKGVPVTPQEKYYVTMKMRNVGISTAHLQVQGRNSTSVLYPNLLDAPASLSIKQDWSTLLGTFTVPQGVSEIRMRIVGRVDAFIDNVYLVKDPNPQRLLGTVTNLRGNDAVLWGDIFGDWREEIITNYNAPTGPELRIYGSPILATSRRPSLMEDMKYRTDVAHQAMGYIQSPTASYLLSQQAPTPVEQFFEAENIANVVATDAVVLGPDINFSGGSSVTLMADAVNDYVSFTLNVLAPGTYAVKVRYKRHPNRGKMQLSIDGVDHGPVVDQYYGGGAWVETNLGSKNFTTAGNKTFTFRVTGKHASAGAYYLNFDYLKLTPQ